MNLFGFSQNDALQGLFLAYGYGVTLGFAFALLRFMIMNFLEYRKL
jgi:hypothetical protein